jgi:hypothetical protein
LTNAARGSFGVSLQILSSDPCLNIAGIGCKPTLFSVVYRDMVLLSSDLQPTVPSGWKCFCWDDSSRQRRLRTRSGGVNYQRDPKILRRTMSNNDQPCTIIEVLPAGIPGWPHGAQAFTCVWAAPAGTGSVDRIGAGDSLHRHAGRWLSF